MADEPVTQTELVQSLLLRMRAKGRDILCQTGIQTDQRLVEQSIIARQACHIEPHHVLSDLLDIGR